MEVRVKRLVAITIDLIPYLIILRITSPLFNIIKFNNIILKIGVVLIYYIVLGIALCAKDVLFGCESMGKKIMRLKVINQEGKEEKNKMNLFRRNCYSLFTVFFPMYPYMILFNNRSFGDLKMKTEVKAE